MADKKKKVVPPNPLFLYPIFVLMLIALFFEALGSPYDVYKLDEMIDATNGCYSLWGVKECGGSHPKAWHNDHWKTCGVFEASMKAGASFSIISLFSTFMSAFLAILAACKMVSTKAPVVLFLLFAVVTTTVPWAVIAGLYHNPTCRFGRMKDMASYAAGFAFFIVAWGVTVICFVLSFFV